MHGQHLRRRFVATQFERTRGRFVNFDHDRFGIDVAIIAGGSHRPAPNSGGQRSSELAVIHAGNTTTRSGVDLDDLASRLVDQRDPGKTNFVYHSGDFFDDSADQSSVRRFGGHHRDTIRIVFALGQRKVERLHLIAAFDFETATGVFIFVAFGSHAVEVLPRRQLDLEHPVGVGRCRGRDFATGFQDFDRRAGHHADVLAIDPLTGNTTRYTGVGLGGGSDGSRDHDDGQCEIAEFGEHGIHRLGWRLSSLAVGWNMG